MAVDWWLFISSKFSIHDISDIATTCIYHHHHLLMIYCLKQELLYQTQYSAKYGGNLFLIKMEITQRSEEQMLEAGDVQPKSKLSWALLHSIWQEEWAVDWSYWCGKLPIYLHFETPVTVAHWKRMEIALHKCCYLEAAVTKKTFSIVLNSTQIFLK